MLLTTSRYEGCGYSERRGRVTGEDCGKSTQALAQDCVNGPGIDWNVVYYGLFCEYIEIE